MLQIVEELPAPPDGGYGWIICGVSFIINGIVDGIPACFGIVFNDLLQHLNATPRFISITSSLCRHFDNPIFDEIFRVYIFVYIANWELLLLCCLEG